MMEWCREEITIIGRRREVGLIIRRKRRRDGGGDASASVGVRTAITKTTVG